MENTEKSRSEAGANMLHRITREYDLCTLAELLDSLASNLVAVNEEETIDFSTDIWRCLWLRDVFNTAAGELGEEQYIPHIR